jgi:uncharacterized membrane protein
MGRIPALRAGRRRPGRQLLYWPLAAPFLLTGLLVLLVLLLMAQVGSYTFYRLGIGPSAALLILLASLLGSAVNLPVARLRNHVVQVHRTISVFGVRYLVPMMTRRNTVIAVNVGGALVPVALSAYLIAHDGIGWQALAAITVVAIATHIVARPVPGLGIAVPALLPGVFAALTAIVIHPVAVAGLAYAAGTLGTLIGADLTNLGKVRRLGSPLVSIGGAGTFDGVFVAGIVAVLLASLA